MKLPWQKSIPVLSPHEGYQRWAPHYSVESNPIKNLSNDTIQRFLPDLAGKSVLDAGCGAGYFCTIAQKARASRILGIDFSSHMLEEAKRNCPSGEFQRIDIANEAIQENDFDVVILALVLGHIQNINSTLSNLARVLRPGGTFILSDFHPSLTLKKAKRTFKDETGKLFEIQHHLHPLGEISETLLQSDVTLEELVEPVWNHEPVIYVIRAKKKE